METLLCGHRGANAVKHVDLVFRHASGLASIQHPQMAVKTARDQEMKHSSAKLHLVSVSRGDQKLITIQFNSKQGKQRQVAYETQFSEIFFL